MPDNFPTDGPISLGDSLGTDKSISYFIGYCGGTSPDAPYSLKALVELAQNEGIEFPNGDFAAPYSMSEFYAMLCGDACSLGTHNGDTFIISSSCSILMDDGSYVLMDSGDNLLLDDCVTSSGDTISCGGQDTSCCIELFDGSCILLADGVDSLDLAVCS
jgi:hypothetical protein